MLKILKIKIFILLFLSANSAYSIERAEQIVAQLTPTSNITFTAENIEKYPQYKDYFIKYALDNFLRHRHEENEIKNKEFDFLLKKYPESIKLFAQKAIDNWSEVGFDEIIFQKLLEIILYYPQSINVFIDKLFEQNQEKLFAANFIHILEFFLHHTLRIISESNDIVKVTNAKIIMNELSKKVNTLDIAFITSLILPSELALKTLDIFYYVLTPEKRKLIKDLILQKKADLELDIFPFFTSLNITLYPELNDYYKKYAIDNLDKIISEDKQKAFMKLWNTNSDFTQLLIDEIKKNRQNISSNLLPIIIVNLRNHPEIISNLIINRDFSKWETIIDYLNKLKSSFEFVDLVENIISHIKQLTIKYPTEIPVSNLEDIYKTLLNDSEKDQLKKEYLKKYKNITFVSAIEGQQPIPYFLKEELESENKIATQSKQHLLTMQREGKAVKFINRHFSDPEIKKFFSSIYAQEKVEHANNNYVFFHGRMWHWNLQSDIFKQLWNIAKNDHVGESYQFLRFGTKIPGPKRDKIDVLFMNSAILGNFTNTGSNTVYYWLTNTDQSIKKNLDITLRGFFKSFNLESLYDKYQKEFEELVTIHKSATKRGEILLISIPPNKLKDNVVPIESGGRGIQSVLIKDQPSLDPKTILDAIKNNPQDVKNIDNLEWGLILGKWDKKDKYSLSPYATDPYNGPTVYSFYLADEKIMEEYRNKRDQLFDKIKKDAKEINKIKKSSFIQQAVSFIKSKL